MKQRESPRARLDCLTRELEGEIVIYDPQRHAGHCLNATAAAVWKLCDGHNNPSEIASALSRQLSAPVDQTVVLLALQRLADVHLLEEPQVPLRPSRRVAIRRIGVAAAIALPLITSIVAPTPANAASCFHGGHACAVGPQCCSGICLPVTGCLGG
jgi:hypothetical protein